MQKPTNLHIATPCHEDWNKMLPADAGKYCASCRQQVVDFTSMSDAQILQFVAGHSGGLCGRFDAGQLNRPLSVPVPSKKRSWYLALALPLSLFFQKSFGQKLPRTMGKPVLTTEQKLPEPPKILLGMTSPSLVREWVRVQGTVSNEKGMPVEYASVTVQNKPYACVADSTGRFTIQVRSREESVVLAVSAIGYRPVERKVSIADVEKDIVLTLTTAEAVLDTVVVTSYEYDDHTYDTSYCSGEVKGTLSVFYPVSYAEKRDSAVRKLLRLTPATVYPNPARSGGLVQLKYRKEGRYEVQLLNSASVLLKTETVRSVSAGTTLPFQLPGLAAGVYYLRLISEDKKNPYVEKILVEK